MYSQTGLQCMSYSSTATGCKDLLRRLLTSNPEDRIKMSELVAHPWLSEGEHLLPFEPAPFPNFVSINDINEDVTEHMVHVLKVAYRS